MITRPENCPECGIKRTVTLELGVPVNQARVIYSCSHYEQWSQENHCEFCDKPDAPARQVPGPMPLSLCYCDDCYDKCVEFCREILKHRRE